jgi:SAM-dependent methyltransferase
VNAFTKDGRIWQIDVPKLYYENAIHVDLGGGSNPRNPFSASKIVVIDLFSPRSTNQDSWWDPRSRNKEIEFLLGDLTRTLPFSDCSVDSISAFDVLEHIPKWERVGEDIRFPFVELMSEIFRCLKPGGIFIALTPAYPSSVIFGDPTHVNQISLETAGYFAKKLDQRDFTPLYGFKGIFNLIHNDWLRGGGPFLTESVTNSFPLSNRFGKIKLSSKLVFRFLRTHLNLRKPSHILWVMEKPSINKVLF